LKPFDATRFEARRRAAGTALGAPLTTALETGSTNDDALKAARAGAPHGSLFVAERQSAGRGRHGRAWLGEPGASLLCSLVLRPKLAPARAGAFPLLVGLCVRAAAARHSAAPILVKWPNDVMAADRKLAGVLVESAVAGIRLGFVVIGIGINVTSHPTAGDLELAATSLAELGARDVERELLLTEVLSELDARLERFLAHGVASLLAELARFDALRDRPVDVDGRRGIARGVDSEGALLLETEAGVEPTISGTVRLLGA
jgi:BirA family biotin operon repressor/biotin-[acetyl-CoA-carboxylase] ligase